PELGAHIGVHRDERAGRTRQRQRLLHGGGARGGERRRDAGDVQDARAHEVVGAEVLRRQPAGRRAAAVVEHAAAAGGHTLLEEDRRGRGGIGRGGYLHPFAFQRRADVAAEGIG